MYLIAISIPLASLFPRPGFFQLLYNIQAISLYHVQGQVIAPSYQYNERYVTVLGAVKCGIDSASAVT